MKGAWSPVFNAAGCHHPLDPLGRDAPGKEGSHVKNTKLAELRTCGRRYREGSMEPRASL